MLKFANLSWFRFKHDVEKCSLPHFDNLQNLAIGSQKNDSLRFFNKNSFYGKIIVSLMIRFRIKKHIFQDTSKI